MQMIRAQVFIALVGLLGGCGKYGPPVPPEALAPSAVSGLAVSGSAEGVTLAWVAPELNQRKRELDSIDGYTVLRRDADADGNGTAEGDRGDRRFTELVTVPDTHLEVQRELREKARAEGTPTSRVKVDPALKRFTFIDRTPTAGAAYIYKVVPFNQGGVTGGVRDEYRVVFNGANSEVSRLMPGGLAALGEVDPFGSDEEDAE
jgi:hypothetical protein